MFEDDHKEGYSLIWDENGKFRNQTWAELKARLLKTQGGLGVLADDFLEMLQYRPAPFRGKTGTLRIAFSELVAEASSDEDIKLLAKVLNIMLIEPWKANIDGGFFIAQLLTNDSKDFEAEKAALILNQLYLLNSYATHVLCRTLTGFFEDYSDSLTLMDKIRNTNKLDRDIVLLITPAKIFISYAKEDNELAECLSVDLEKKGFVAWKDTHELLPGEQWEDKIKKSLEENDFVVLCLSKKSVAKTGFFQVEIKEALKWQQYRPEHQIYIIPVRFDDCDIPNAIKNIHYVDLFPNWNDGVERIATAIIKYRK